MKFRLLVILFLAEFTSAYTINSCTTINNSGTYILTTDLININQDCIEINADNVVFDCQGHRIDGTGWGYVGIQSISHKNLTIRNCILSDWEIAIFFDGVNNSKVTDITAYSCPSSGIEFDLSHYNTLSNLNLTDNDMGGIVLLGSSHNNLSDIYINGNNNSDSVGMYIGFYDIGLYSDYNNVENATIMSNDYGIMIEDSHHNSLSKIVVNTNKFGIDFSVSRNNILYHSQIKHNSRQGIYLEGANNSQIYFNIIEDNGYSGIPISAGIVISDNATNNLIYNNLFNNTVNAYFVTTNVNYWNVEIQSGTRIFTTGKLIGGNYWSDYSCSCGSDGFCFGKKVRGYLSKTLASNNKDNFPLCQYYPSMVGGTTTIPKIPELELEPSPFEITVISYCQTELIYARWTGNVPVNVIIKPSPTVSKYLSRFPSKLSLLPDKTTAIPMTACLPKDVIKIDGKLTFIVREFPEQKEVPTTIKIGKPTPKVVCGDSVCSKGENWLTCPKDCPFPYFIVLIIGGVAVYIVVSSL